MEVEAKYTLSALVTPAQIEALSWTPYHIAQPEIIDQHDTFFDTAERSLSQTRHAVRVRRANDRLLVTLKGPGTVAAGVHSRPELEVPTVDAAPEHWPAEIRSKLRELIGEQPLQPLFTVHNLRRTWVLMREDQRLGEVALDEGTIEAGEQHLPMHELEIELKGGTAGDLDALARMVAQYLPAQPEDRSKFARGLALLSDVT
jgi:inorganic triphosphatase YgiF